MKSGLTWKVLIISRYHIVKKRIDKVTVRGTQERVTQPGKIALIYFSQKEAE